MRLRHFFGRGRNLDIFRTQHAAAAHCMGTKSASGQATPSAVAAAIGTGVATAVGDGGNGCVFVQVAPADHFAHHPHRVHFVGERATAHFGGETADDPGGGANIFLDKIGAEVAVDGEAFAQEIERLGEILRLGEHAGEGIAALGDDVFRAPEAAAEDGRAQGMSWRGHRVPAGMLGETARHGEDFFRMGAAGYRWLPIA